MPTRYGRSPWVDQFPKSRVPTYPKHRGPLKIDVAIVGGGLAGCATAYAFAAAGVKVALFEAGRLGQGGSGASTGWISEDPGVVFADVEKVAGLGAARSAWRAWRRASLDFVALIKRLDIKCRLEPRGSLLVAATPDDAVRLTRDLRSRRAAGLEGSLMSARAILDDTAITASAGIRSPGGATIDPYRATLGLAAAAAHRGAQIFEQSPVKAITFNRKDACVSTAGGAFRVGRVVVATAMPTALHASLARHFWMKSTYLALTEPVPAKIRSHLGRRSAVLRDSATPPHVLRWVDDERLLIEGASAGRAAAKSRDKTIVQRTGQLMYELSTYYPDVSGLMPAYGWEAPFALTAVGVPYIGPHRNFPHQLFAFGDSSHGVTGAYLASRILLRHHLGELDAADEAFAFTR